MSFGQIIHRTVDDSYIIMKNGLPYHVYPYAAEFAEEWDAVFAYAEEHPEMVTEEEPYVPPVPTLEEAKAAKLAEINAAADRAISKLTATYPDREIATFDKQEAEASAYLINGMKSSGKKRDNLGSIGKGFRWECNSIAKSATKKEGNQPSFFVVYQYSMSTCSTYP